MRFVFIILFSFVLCSLFCQNRNFSKFSFDISAGILNAQAKIGRAKPITPTPEVSVSISTNLYYSIKPNKFLLFTGIGYRKINQILREKAITLPYSELGATINSDDDLFNQYGYSFASGIGNIDLNIELRATQFKDGLDYIEGDNIEMEYASILVFSYITLPVGVQYNLQNKKNTLYLKAGGILNFISNFQVSKQQLDLKNFFINRGNRQRIFVEDVSANHNFQHFRDIVPEFFIAVGLESSIHRKFSIYGDIKYTFPLSSFYSDGMVSTSFNVLGAFIGCKVIL